MRTGSTRPRKVGRTETVAGDAAADVSVAEVGRGLIRPPPVASLMSEATALAYYEAIDAGDYEAFADLLAPEVVHDRPDRTIEGKETLVGFMRDDRPNRDTSHEVLASFEKREGDAVAVEGRLLDSDGDEMFGFVDAFSLREGRIVEIRTYTR